VDPGNIKCHSKRREELPMVAAFQVDDDGHRDDGVSGVFDFDASLQFG
jgi:hypothetical protein